MFEISFIDYPPPFDCGEARVAGKEKCPRRRLR
jgi:hypothetical protein